MAVFEILSFLLEVEIKKSLEFVHVNFFPLYHKKGVIKIYFKELKHSFKMFRLKREIHFQLRIGFIYLIFFFCQIFFFLEPTEEEASIIYIHLVFYLEVSHHATILQLYKYVTILHFNNIALHIF